MEADWVPIDHLNVALTYGYLDARFRNLYLPNASVFTTITGEVVDLRDQSGKDMIRAPRNKASFEGQIPARAAGRRVVGASASFNYTSQQRGELEPYAIQPSYGLLDSRLTWISPDSNWEVALWGKNLADRLHVSHVYTIANEVFGVYGDPRTYGVSVSWHSPL